MKPSRAMITGEISWAFVALCFAWSGSGLWPMQSTYLHDLLDQRAQDVWWTLFIGVPSLGLFVVSLREYVGSYDRRRAPRARAQRWPLEKLERSAHIRGWLCATLAFSWTYIAYMLLKLSARPSAILPVAVGGAVFAIWFLIENRRVQRECRKRADVHSAAAAH
jgi:hypothetical protein